jgi:hypothetical protein
MVTRTLELCTKEISGPVHALTALTHRNSPRWPSNNSTDGPQIKSRRFKRPFSVYIHIMNLFSYFRYLGQRKIFLSVPVL